MRRANLCTPRRGPYSCESAAETIRWMSAIADFLRPLKSLIDAHLVNFFEDRLWEAVDEEWMECLRKEPVEHLLRIPSGFVMEHWPESLQKFVHTIESLVMPREQEALQKFFPDLEVTALDNVLAQGMNPKKKHEIETLAALINAVSNSIGAEEIIDVGAGQGYLAQVLCFQYQHHVTAIDASSHHSAVTSERAERIKKHYVAKLRQKQTENKQVRGPQIVTSKVLSSTCLSALAANLYSKGNLKEPMLGNEDPALQDVENKGTWLSRNHEDAVPPLVLSGLHACGDLSVSMLRAFVDSEHVKALVSIGCCYNLLSEACSADALVNCGFPMSAGARLHALTLGKRARDLSCQSADRWQNLSKDDAIRNFHLHGFRAAFQMFLGKYFPEVSVSRPSIGRQGKALRRRRMRRALRSNTNDNTSTVIAPNNRKGFCNCSLAKKLNDLEMIDTNQEIVLSNSSPRTREIQISGSSSAYGVQSKEKILIDKYELFEDFCQNGMRRLDIFFSEDMDLHGIWNEAHPFFELIGPFWSLRASLGPLLETYLLLDRLLFLQEHACSMEVMMFPLFDPSLSPRNMVIVAQK